MKLTVNGHSTYISTGGIKPSIDNQAIIFLPGSGQSHLTFVLQTRFFAFEGYDVYAPDFPGHGLSKGNPLETIEEMADWVARLMAQCNLKSAIIVGHSQGCLVAMSLAHKYPDLAEKLILIAGALQIKVNDYLLDKSNSSLPLAVTMMTEWGHGRQGHFFAASQPGHSLLGIGRELMMANAQDALPADLLACNQFDATNIAAEIEAPVLCILAQDDKMTPVKLGIKMSDSFKNSTCVTIAQSGHMLPIEKPDDVNSSIQKFLN